MTYEARETAMKLLKVRIDRAGNLRDEYLIARIDGAIEQLAGNGIHLTDFTGDVMLLVDYAAWQYNNRDKTGGMPDWLKLMRRERWLQEIGKRKEVCNDT